jgi:MFS family permease
MTAAMGIGAVVGGLYSAGRTSLSPWSIVTGAGLFGLSVLLTAMAPSLTVAILLLIVVGFFSISFTTSGNTTLQLSTDASMRGRVMALWTVAFLGTTPIGGPLIGAVGDQAGARWSLIAGGIAALVAATYGASVIQRAGKPASEPEVARPSP